MITDEFITELSERTAAIVVQRLDRPHVEKAYYTIKEAAIYTSYTDNALRECIKDKLFVVTGHGNTVRIAKRVLDAWMDSNTH